MHLYILPVSGERFPLQLAYLSELGQLNQRPDVALGTSGGSVASYMGLAGDWHPDGIWRVASTINSDIFLKSWWPSPLQFMPSWLLGLFHGSAFDKGEGSYEYFSNLFTPSTIQETEIWSGTVNRTQDRAELFCNRSENNTLIDTSKYHPDKIGALPLNFCNGDLFKITKSVQASAAIPLIVPEVTHEDCCYVDGGGMFSSPFTPLSRCFSYAEELHIVHLSGRNITEPIKGNKGAGWFSIGTTAVNEVLKSLMIQDRENAINLINPPNYIEVEEGNREVLDYMIRTRKRYKKSMLEIYPREPELKGGVELFGFKGLDVLYSMQKAKRNYSCRLWLGDKKD